MTRDVSELIDFKDAVIRAFEPVTARYGLTCVAASTTCVRFENERVFLQVRFDYGRSFELGLELGERVHAGGGPERPFNLVELLRAKQAAEAPQLELLQTPTADGLRRGLTRLAEATERYAVELLSGDATAFEALAAFRTKESEAYALTRDLRAAREQADTAWREQDYAAVIRAYKPVEAHLTPAEKKKLAVAESRKADGLNGPPRK